jgi:hypothetical protein
MDTTPHSQVWRRRAILGAKVGGVVAACLLVLFIAVLVKVGHDLGGPVSPVRLSGTVGDARIRDEYERSPLTQAQIASIHTGMPADAAFIRLGGRSRKIPVSTRIRGRWVHTGTDYDYPIAGTGHLCEGFTVADELEITISRRTNSVTRIHLKPWRRVCRTYHTW